MEFLRSKFTIIKTSLLAVISGLLLACSTGELPKPTPLQAIKPSTQLVPIWRVPASHGDNELQLNLTPVIGGQTIYAAGQDGSVSAVQISNGNVLWQQRYKQLSFSSNLAVNKQALFIGTNQGQVAKLSKQDGKLNWIQTVPSTVLAAPVADTKQVYIKTINDALTVLTTDTGDAVWQYQASSPSLTLRAAGDPLLEQKQLYVGFADGQLIAFDPTNGKQLWSKKISAANGKTEVERMVDITATPLIDQGVLFFSAYQTKLTALDLTSHDVLWQHEISNYTNFAVDKNAIYLTEASGDIVALNKQTGTVLWQQAALKYRTPTGPASIDQANINVIAVGDAQGYIHLLSKQDGRIIGRTRVDSNGISAQPLVINDRLITQANDGDLYAYQIKQIKPLLP